MRTKLTKRAVDALRASPKHDLYVWDVELPGFGVRVKNGSGAKSFIVQYRVPGMPNVSRRVTIGRFGPLMVNEARTKAKAILGDVAKGLDPAASHAETKRQARDETVSALMDEFLNVFGPAHWKPTTRERFQTLARLYIVPRFGKAPIARVTSRDVNALHLALREKPPTANYCVRLLKMFFNWAAKTERFEGNNPARSVVMYRETACERFLTVEEVARLGEALRTAEKTGLTPAPQLGKHSYKRKNTRPRNAGMFSARIEPANPVAIAALRFIIFTGWRESEALRLKWSHVALSTGIATLPDTKSGRSVRTLGAPAIELLAALPRIEGSAFVFPGRDPSKPLEGIRRLWCAARHVAGLDDVRLHDLRHSAASFAGGRGYSLFLIQKMLGHKTAQSTERYAHLADDVRRLMADDVSGVIAEALEGRMAGASVVPIRSPVSKRSGEVKSR